MKKTQAKRSSSKSSDRNNILSASITRSNEASVSVRAIDNGFIVRESKTVGKGRNTKYQEKEFYSKSNPVQIKVSGKTTNK